MVKKYARKAQKILSYTAVFEKAPEGGYVVSVPSLPGCLTQGDTFEEAVAMVKDAIEGYLAVVVEEEKTLPREADEVVITRVSIPSSHLTLS